MPKFGLSAVTTDYSIPPSHLGTWLEDSGFESIWFGEHSHIPTARKSHRRTTGEVSEQFKQFFDPYITMMAVAACTKTLKLGTSISLVTEHHPISFAKTISTLDQLSNGRVILGVGAGWNEEEMADYGIEFKARWKYVRECVLAMRQIWNNDIAEFHGEFVNFDPMWSWPKPVQRGGPPILLGAQSEYVPKRVADYCNGWIPVDQGEITTRMAREVRDEWERCSRDPADLEMTVALLSALTDNTFSTSEAQMIDRIGELERSGFKRMIFSVEANIPERQWPHLEAAKRMTDAFK